MILKEQKGKVNVVKYDGFSLKQSKCFEKFLHFILHYLTNKSVFFGKKHFCLLEENKVGL